MSQRDTSARHRLALSHRGGAVRQGFSTGSIVTVSLLVGQLLGCAIYGGDSRAIAFAPDSSIVAYVWQDSLSEFAVDGRAWLSSYHLYWITASAPSKRKHVLVDSAVGYSRAYGGFGPVALKFSPDSRHAAVVVGDHLTVVDLGSAKSWRINKGNEAVTSFQWLSAHELGYGTATPLKGREDLYRRTIWSQEISGVPGQRTVLHSGTVSREAVEYLLLHFPIEYWSAKGTYAVFVEDGRFRLLDARTKCASAFGPGPPVYLAQAASWKADESAAFCIGTYIGTPYERLPLAFLVFAEGLETIDCSSGYAADFGKSIPELEEYWTPDNHYIVANDWAGLGGCLIQPDPWKVIRIGENLKKRFELETEYSPSIFSLPVPGFVGVIGLGQAKHPSDLAHKCAVSHDGKMVKPLFNTPGWWAFSPDGKLAAIIWYDHKLTVHEIDLRD